MLTLRQHGPAAMLSSGGRIVRVATLPAGLYNLHELRWEFVVAEVGRVVLRPR